MKKVIVFLAAILMSIATFAQGEKYLATMQNAIAQLEKARTAEAITPLSNKFERIASAEKGEWLPHYYHAYCQIQLALAAMQNNQSDKIGAYVEKAQTSLDNALKITKNNSELQTLQGYIYMANVWESPMIKGMKYGPKAVAAYDKAIEMNPENPRPYLLKGQNLLYTPAMFGGGKEKAKPLFKMAEEKFGTFKPASEIAPTWGARTCAYFVKQVES